MKKMSDSDYVCINRTIEGGGHWEISCGRAVHDTNERRIEKGNRFTHKINVISTMWRMDEYSLKTNDTDPPQVSRLKHF